MNLLEICQLEQLSELGGVHPAAEPEVVNNYRGGGRVPKKSQEGPLI